MTMEMMVALILCLAVLMGWTRLWLWHRAARSYEQVSFRRLTILLLLQPVSAVLLFLALFPPFPGDSMTTLRVATAGAPRMAAIRAGAPLILLPEAPAIDGGEAVPDLATALRRHPGVTAIRVSGHGLGPRDIDAARHLAVRFDPPRPRSGIIDVTPPSAVAPGARFNIGATLAGIGEASAELIDPAGRVTDIATPDKDGHVLLTGTARAAGPAVFTLRVQAGKRTLEQADIPVWVVESVRPRLLILAGAPGPEVKYLRRWASDAGYDVTTRMSAGGGIALGDAPIALNAASLRGFDVAIVDERSWPGLRGPLLVAVRGGMGLVLRAGGAVDGATRSQWQALGFALNGPGGIVPLALPELADERIVRTHHGIGRADVPVDMALPDDMVPDVSRLGLTPGGSDAVPVLRDAAGASLAAWRNVGAGRVALFNVLDSYALTLTGRRDLYDDWWNSMLGTVARPAPANHMTTQTAWTGERMTLCDLSGEGRISKPGGGQAAISPVSGCGAFWPVRGGWHYLRTAKDVRAIFVQPDTALPAMRSMRDRHAMAMLSVDTGDMTTTPPSVYPPSAWPFWLGWLAVSALLWWLERSRLGRDANKVQPPLATRPAAS